MTLRRFFISLNCLVVGLFHLTIFFVVLLILLPVQFLVSCFPPSSPLRQKIQLSGYALLVKSLGIRLKITGTAKKHSPCLYISNHSSYTDILILGSLVPASFVSKHEVKSWPLVGYFARLQGTLFIHRSKSHIHSHQREIWNCLAEDRNLILFPEGTTNHGSRVFPFKSSLLSNLDQKMPHQELFLQPVSICYSHSKGIPFGRKDRWEASWTGEESLLPHFLSLLSKTPLRVHVHFSPAFSITEAPDRKHASQKLETLVSQGLSLIFQGEI